MTQAGWALSLVAAAAPRRRMRRVDTSKPLERLLVAALALLH